MAGILIVPGLWPVIDANGTPVSGATINFYEPNTTTPKAVYSDDTLATSLGTSLTTNAGGEPTTLAGTVARLWWAADAGVYDVEVIAGASTRTWSGVAVSDSAVMSRLVYDADYATLALAVSDAISRGQSLYITQDHTISTNTTIACPVIVDGGSFSVNEFRTLTFTRGLDAGWEQIFLGLGLVTGLRDVAAEWWGAKSDDTGDASIGWNKANACRMSAALSGTTVGEWRHRLNERGTYRFMSTAELHVSATAGLTMRGGGPIFQTILKAGSGSSGTILLKITAPLSGLDKIVTFDIGGFSVVEEAGTSMICGLQVGDTVTGSYGDKTYAIKGITYSTISNVQSNGFTNGFKNVNAGFVEYNNCTAWNQSSEAFIGFWDYCDRAGAVGFINYNNCYVAGNFGDVTRIGHLTDSTSGGYATRIIGTIVMEDSGYQRFMKYAEGGALANIEVGSASELDGDLNPATSARGVFVQCEDLLAYAGPASSCRNIIINGIWCAGHNDAAVTFKTVKTGSMRDIKILNSAIANHTGNAILIDGPIDGVMISNVSFQECSSVGPLVWLTGGVTKAVIDGVTLTQPTPALTVSSIVQIDSTCDNVSVESIIADVANCASGLIINDLARAASGVSGSADFSGAVKQSSVTTNGATYWSSDTPKGQNITAKNRLLMGALSTGSEAQLSGTNWVSDPAQLGAHWMVRSSDLGSATITGGTAIFGATRNGDKYKTPLQTANRTVWAIGQVITIGNIRANRYGVYQATNNGTTGFPGPSHKSGTVADGGGVSWLFLSDRQSYMVSIAGSLVSIADVSDGEGTWTLYQESNRQAGGGVSFGREVAVKNKGSNVTADPFVVVQDGATIGDWFAGGGDPVYFGAPANPSTVAIAIGKNGSTWNSGIIFMQDALTAVGGRAGAIQMSNNHEIQWFASAGVTKFGIRYDNNASARETRLVSNGFTTELRGVRSTGVEETVFSVSQPDLSAVGARTNFFFADANVNTGAAGSGHVQLTASGYDTNIDIRLTPKGTGLVRFGNSTTAATVPANFTADRILFIKDGSGTSYAIPCRATGW